MDVGSNPVQDSWIINGQIRDLCPDFSHVELECPVLCSQFEGIVQTRVSRQQNVKCITQIAQRQTIDAGQAQSGHQTGPDTCTGLDFQMASGQLAQLFEQRNAESNRTGCPCRYKRVLHGGHHSGGMPQNVQANDWLAVLGYGQAWWVLFDILGLGVFGGFYIVPLYALIQSRTAENERARVIAANNILNALFMVVSAIVSILLLSVAKLSIPELFLVVSLLNVAVNAYIFKIVPEFTMRFMIWLLSHSMYRVEHRNLELIPDEGAALLVCNHVSFVDALLIGGAVRRPIRFVMYYKIYRLPVLNFIFRTAGTIPIAGRNEDIQIYEKAFTRIAQYLKNGELVCIFPEGKLTSDGEMNEFRGGVTRILEETPVPVIPLALQGLWGSFFSRDPNKGFFHRIWSRVTLVVGQPVTAQAATPSHLQGFGRGTAGGGEVASRVYSACVLLASGVAPGCSGVTRLLHAQSGNFSLYWRNVFGQHATELSSSSAYDGS